MDRVRAELEEFRLRKQQKTAEETKEAQSASQQKESEVQQPTRHWLGVIYDFLDSIDPLDAAPFRLWRYCYERFPQRTLYGTILLYILGQVFFIWAEFGAVFFVISCFIAMCLGMGHRRKGEVSAYSVFNPGCERLLGSMTAEHFERDMLHRR